MKIVLAGGSGFLGRAAAERLSRDHQILVLTRNPSHVSTGSPLVWDGRSDGPWMKEVATADAVINLAGENIGDGRWTAKRKASLLRSRVDATSALVRALESERRDRLFVSASAVGYYGDRGEEELTETSVPGGDFLSEVCVRWEAAARQADPFARLVILRLGVVFDRDEGAFPRLVRPVRMFAGGPVGSGRQWISWIDSADVVRIIEWCINDRSVQGVFNATAPAPVRNGELVRLIAKALHRPHMFRAPEFAIRLALGKMGEELLLSSQKARPERLLAAGFRFEYDGAPTEVDHLLVTGR